MKTKVNKYDQWSSLLKKGTFCQLCAEHASNKELLRKMTTKRIYTYNQKEMTEISREWKRRLGEFDTLTEHIEGKTTERNSE